MRGSCVWRDGSTTDHHRTRRRSCSPEPGPYNHAAAGETRERSSSSSVSHHRDDAGDYRLRGTFPLTTTRGYEEVGAPMSRNDRYGSSSERSNTPSSPRKEHWGRRNRDDPLYHRQHSYSPSTRPSLGNDRDGRRFSGAGDIQRAASFPPRKRSFEGSFEPKAPGTSGPQPLLKIHPKLAGRFVPRDGLTAYTIVGEKKPNSSPPLKKRLKQIGDAERLKEQLGDIVDWKKIRTDTEAAATPDLTEAASIASNNVNLLPVVSTECLKMPAAVPVKVVQVQAKSASPGKETCSPVSKDTKDAEGNLAHKTTDGDTDVTEQTLSTSQTESPSMMTLDVAVPRKRKTLDSPSPSKNDTLESEALVRRVDESKPKKSSPAGTDASGKQKQEASPAVKTSKTDPSTSSGETDCSDPSLVKVGCRVAVFWDGEGEFFEGVVTKERRGKKPFYVEYDDGDKEWVNFEKELFHLVENSSRKYNERQKKQKGRRNSRKESVGSRRTAERKKKSKEGTAVPGSALGINKRADGGEEMPAVTDASRAASSKPSHAGITRVGETGSKDDEDWVASCVMKQKQTAGESSDSETDEEEVMQFACKMFGIHPPPRPIARPKTEPAKTEVPCSCSLIEPSDSVDWQYELSDIPMSISEKVKLGRRRSRNSSTVSATEASSTKPIEPLKNNPTKKERSHEELCAEMEREARRKKEESRPLTAAEIRSILGEDDLAQVSTNWVRRSVRQPSKSSVNAPQVKALIDKLKTNDTDMEVLKMKKYCSDSATPVIVIDAVLDALEENTNCQALYIQNFNEGMRDEQVLRLLRILQRPSCKIWCLNIGETYKVKTKTWKKFADGLADTKITHMYASEHTITSELKEQIRATIRDNRRKHNMHIDPENLDVIVQCTHCWWNPINAKVLRPFLHKRGYAHILNDAEAQGLRGTKSGSAGATLA